MNISETGSKYSNFFFNISTSFSIQISLNLVNLICVWFFFIMPFYKSVKIRGFLIFIFCCLYFNFFLWTLCVCKDSVRKHTSFSTKKIQSIFFGKQNKINGYTILMPLILKIKFFLHIFFLVNIRISVFSIYSK